MFLNIDMTTRLILSLNTAQTLKLALFGLQPRYNYHFVDNKPIIIFELFKSSDVSANAPFKTLVDGNRLKFVFTNHLNWDPINKYLNILHNGKYMVLSESIVPSFGDPDSVAVYTF